MAEQEKETLDQQPPLEEQAAEQTEAETAAETPEEAAARMDVPVDYVRERMG